MELRTSPSVSCIGACFLRYFAQRRFGASATPLFTLKNSTTMKATFRILAALFLGLPASILSVSAQDPYTLKQAIPPPTASPQSGGQLGYSVAVEGGFLLLGRAEGAEAKGCSIAVQEFLEAALTVRLEPFDDAQDRPVEGLSPNGVMS